jgi:transposase-like protein
MRARDKKRLMALTDRLGASERRALIARLRAQAAASESIELVEATGHKDRRCPGCGNLRVVRNGQADGLQRYKCRGCGKTFNALTGTPLARLRHKSKWIEQAGVLAEGLTVHRAAQRLGVAPSTAFRWRHRFLALPRSVKPALLCGVAEIDETYVLESFKGQKLRRQKLAGRAPRKRGGHAAKRGLSKEQIPVLVARDRSGATTDFVLVDTRKAAVKAILQPLLAPDAVVCCDGGGSIGQAARDLGLEHHAVITSKGVHAVGAWHIQNVNAYHSRLKGWLRRFHGVATSYLENYLGWFRALDRTPPNTSQPALLLNLALGR